MQILEHDLFGFILVNFDSRNGEIHYWSQGLISNWFQFPPNANSKPLSNTFRPAHFKQIYDIHNMNEIVCSFEWSRFHNTILANKNIGRSISWTSFASWFFVIHSLFIIQKKKKNYFQFTSLIVRQKKPMGEKANETPKCTFCSGLDLLRKIQRMQISPKFRYLFTISHANV